MRTSLALIVTLLVGAALPLEAAPAITVTPLRISVTGVTPGADVLFFGMGFEPKKNIEVILHRWSAVAAAQNDGTAAYALTDKVTWNALWIVADLRTGQYAIASTPGFQLARAFYPARELKRDPSGTINRFLYGRRSADFVYVAAGGAWTHRVHDGESTDADGQNDDRISLNLSQLRRIGGSGPETPLAFTPGGTLFVIDPARLDLLELRIDASLLAGVR
jgi:hypothetical protein